MKRKQEKPSVFSQQRDEGLRIGDMLTFFINGGNDTKWTDRKSAEDALIMTLAYVNHQLPRPVYMAIIEECGLIEKHNAAGSLILQRGPHAFANREEREKIRAETPKQSISTWLDESINSHGIYDAKGVAAEFKLKTGLDACWPTQSVRDTQQQIDERGVGGHVDGNAGDMVARGFDIAEALAEKYAAKHCSHRMYSGRGRRFAAAVEALRKAGA